MRRGHSAGASASLTSRWPGTAWALLHGTFSSPAAAPGSRVAAGGSPPARVDPVGASRGSFCGHSTPLQSHGIAASVRSRPGRGSFRGRKSAGSQRRNGLAQNKDMNEADRTRHRHLGRPGHPMHNRCRGRHRQKRYDFMISPRIAAFCGLTEAVAGGCVLLPREQIQSRSTSIRRTPDGGFCLVRLIDWTLCARGSHQILILARILVCGMRINGMR